MRRLRVKGELASLLTDQIVRANQSHAHMARQRCWNMACGLHVGPGNSPALGRRNRTQRRTRMKPRAPGQSNGGCEKTWPRRGSLLRQMRKRVWREKGQKSGSGMYQ